MVERQPRKIRVGFIGVGRQEIGKRLRVSNARQIVLLAQVWREHYLADGRQFFHNRRHLLEGVQRLSVVVISVGGEQHLGGDLSKAVHHASHAEIRRAGREDSAKAGVHHLSRALSLEWAKQGVTVNVVAPCITETDSRRMILERPGYKEWATNEALPIGRWNQPEDLVGAVLFLSSHLSDMVVGHVLMVDGGWTIH